MKRQCVQRLLEIPGVRLCQRLEFLFEELDPLLQELVVGFEVRSVLLNIEPQEQA